MPGTASAGSSPARRGRCSRKESPRVPGALCTEWSKKLGPPSLVSSTPETLSIASRTISACRRTGARCQIKRLPASRLAAAGSDRDDCRNAAEFEDQPVHRFEAEALRGRSRQPASRAIRGCDGFAAVEAEVARGLDEAGAEVRLPEAIDDRRGRTADSVDRRPRPPAARAAWPRERPASDRNRRRARRSPRSRPASRSLPADCGLPRISMCVAPASRGATAVHARIGGHRSPQPLDLGEDPRPLVPSIDAGEPRRSCSRGCNRGSSPPRPRPRRV